MKTTEEKNRMIAEFMGIHEIMLDEESKYDTDDISHLLGFAILPKLSTISSDELLFHTSWSWIMPVVGKCLEICHEEMLNEWENSFVDAFLSTSFDLMFKEVTQFIKWYNKNKEL